MANTNKLIQNITTELKAHVDPIYREGSQRFFKQLETQNRFPFGVRLPIVRKIGNTYYKELKDLSKKEIFTLAKQLLKKKEEEYSTIAFAWIFKRKHEFKPSDFSFFKKIVENHVTNWARCDDFCTHALGSLLMMYPELVPKIKKWTTSKNLWMRRAAAVSFIYPARKNMYINDIFEIASILLQDTEDMVQKGYGWMLKDASLTVPTKVYKFVMRNKQKMPRTALRYAIERFPKEMRQECIKLNKKKIHP